MGKKLIIKGADFSANAVDTAIVEVWVNNTFSWGKGGISRPGVSSGSTNSAMSMTGLPLQYAEREMRFRTQLGYTFAGILTSEQSSPPATSGYTYRNDLSGTEYTVPAGTYYEFQIMRSDGQNADITQGPSALQILQTQ